MIHSPHLFHLVNFDFGADALCIQGLILLRQHLTLELVNVLLSQNELARNGIVLFLNHIAYKRVCQNCISQTLVSTYHSRTQTILC